MKKTYIIPEMEIIEVKAQQILAGSIPVDGTTNNASDAEAPEFEWTNWEF